jgi:acyl-CoA thioesterase-1
MSSAILLAVAMVCFLGFERGPKAVYAEESPIRVLFLGDSLTAGYGVGVGAAYPAVVERLAALDSVLVHAINAGLSGDTSAGGLFRIDRYLQQDFDAIFVALGANDALRGLDPETMYRNLAQLIAKVRMQKPTVKVFLGGMRAPPNLGEEYGERYSAAFVRLAADSEAILLPFLLDGVAADRALNLADTIHPNEHGHQVIGKRVWALLKGELRRESGS